MLMLKINILSTNEAKKLILEAFELGVKSIVFTGGEPLMRNDILSLIEFTVDVGLKPILVTNGTLLNDYILKRLKELNVSIAINLPTINEEIHKEFTKINSSLKLKLQAIDKCLKYGLKCSIGVAITKLNYKHIDDVLNYAISKSLYVDLLAVIPCGRAQVEIILSGFEYYNLLQYLWRKWKVVPMNMISHGKYISIYEPIYLALLAENGINNLERLCSIGKAIVVMEDGNVRPCIFIPYTIGNVRKKSLKQIWKRLIEDKFITKLKDSKKLKGPCKTCSFKTICGGCRARAYFIKGDYFTSDPICWKVKF